MKTYLTDEEVAREFDKYASKIGILSRAEILDFILNLRQSDRQFLRERIEGMKRGELGIEGTPFYGSLEARKQSRIHNEALDKILELLTPTNN